MSLFKLLVFTPALSFKYAFFEAPRMSSWREISSQCGGGNLGSFNEDQCLSLSLINFFTPLKLTKINQFKPEKSNQKSLQPVEINKEKNCYMQTLKSVWILRGYLKITLNVEALKPFLT